jgi:copper(I)-binding protein
MLGASACAGDTASDAAGTPEASTSTPVAAASATETATPIATIVVQGAWARSTPGNAQENSAGYAVLTNNAKEPDQLVSASVDPKIAAKFELHRTVRTGDVMKMEPVTAFDIAPNGGALTLEPAGITTCCSTCRAH